jgi:hypothetical protein
MRFKLINFGARRAARHISGGHFIASGRAPDGAQSKLIAGAARRRPCGGTLDEGRFAPAKFGRTTGLRGLVTIPRLKCQSQPANPTEKKCGARSMTTCGNKSGSNVIFRTDCHRSVCFKISARSYRSSRRVMGSASIGRWSCPMARRCERWTTPDCIF